MHKDKWVINRVGLLNFWYYDEEEFNFLDGKLLLRGSNGSGKSVTMQSFVPLLLDGNKSPERLDPFGSRARKMENYLLGEEETGKDESTGYIYMEFKKQESQKYITIGMGLNAKRGKGLNSWGFVINDGRRIGKDFFLYKNIGEKVPLSKKELKNRIQNGGEIAEDQKQYMSLVNRYLFGFDNIEDYDELIKLLIQLRTPKLSKEFKPTVVYEIMNNSLQPLSDDDLRPMSEAIENMDNIKVKLEDLKTSYKAAEQLEKSYDQYNRFILFEKAKDFTKSNETLRNIKKDKNELNIKREGLRRDYDEADKKITNLEIRQKTLEEKKRELEKHDSYNIKLELSKLEENLKELHNEETQKSDSLNTKLDRERAFYQEAKKLEEEKSYKINEIKEKLLEMDDLAESFKFHEEVFMKDELIENICEAYDFSYVKSQIKSYSERIMNARKALEEEEFRNNEYDNGLLELERSKKEKDSKEKNLERARLLFSEIKEEFIENMHLWQRNNKELKPIEEVLVEIRRKVSLYGEKTTFDDIIGDMRSEYNRFEGNLNKELYKLDSIEKQYKDHRDEKEQIILEWKNKKDPEPERQEKVMLNRKRLARENIPFIPFYLAVDFKEGLSGEEKGRYEEALLDMGILDSIIIPHKYRKKVLEMDKNMADKYLFSSPKILTHELTLKLKAENTLVEGISREDVETVLRTILVDEQQESTYVNEHGEYGIGLIRGKTSRNYTPKFIGSSARKMYREEMLLQLSKEKEEIEGKIKEVQESINKVKKRLLILKEEYNAFPDKNDLETALGEQKVSEFEYDKALKDVQAKEEMVDSLYKLLKDIRQKVHSLTYNMEIGKNLKAFKEAEEDAAVYKELLSDLEREHLKLLQIVNLKQTTDDRKEEIDIDIEEIRYDLSKIDLRIKQSQERKKSLSEQLQISGFEDIEKEINNCIEGLNNLPKEIKESIEKKTKLFSELNIISEKLENIDKEIFTNERLNEALEDGFKEEYMLQYVFKAEENEDIERAAESIYADLKYLEKQGKTKDDYMGNLQNKYHETRQFMAEYSLKLEHIFEKNIENIDEDVREVYLRQKRLELMGRIRGTYVNFYSLIQHIKEGIFENEKLLRESDRQLFEDILAKNISKKIRGRIYNSEEWVKKMNLLMESMNTSSGLSFSLSWKNKSAETEEQLDTRELVQLLKKDGNLLTENEIDKLSTHFRSKIEEARRRIEEKEASTTFHSIMKEVLDYRKWFEFRLFYKKINENKKELTNNAFYKFSGGEKAMAMYVPLFSAVYSKYEGARKDCPKIISLDEAFAGVDENNIRDMFRLLNELGLNYIINSQILWGDYDTVPSLSICELVRPNNANFVTVIRYKWNGKVRELALNEGEYCGEKETAATML